MKKLGIAVLGLMVLFGCSSADKKLTDDEHIAIKALHKKVTNLEVPSCQSTREYITALEFLRSGRAVTVKEQRARELADQISKGCTGAADRFAKVTTILVKAGVGGRDSIKSGLKFVHRDDADAAAFVSVFKYAYLKAYLDMTLINSVRVAHMLSNEFDGDKSNVLHDFKEMVDFCKDTKNLKIPKPECGLLAGRVAKGGEAAGKSVYDDYEDLYEFLISDSGPKYQPNEAAYFAKDIIGMSPVSAKAFMRAYKYSSSKKGLGKSKSGSIEFARNMARRSKHPSLKK